MSDRREFAKNHRVLTQALDELVHFLRLRLQGNSIQQTTFLETPPALARLAERLNLTRFEQVLLFLAAAPDLDARFKQIFAEAHGDAAKPWLTFGLALDCLPDPEWRAITPVGRLRRWQLLELVGMGSALDARVVVDETILHHIAGLSYPDPRIEPWFRQETIPEDACSEWSDSLQNGEMATSIAAISAEWQNSPSLALSPVVRVKGVDGFRLLHCLASQLGLKVYRLFSYALPEIQPERETLARLWEREALLRGALLWVDVEYMASEEESRFADFIDRLQSLIVFTGSHALPLRRTQHQIALPIGSVETRLSAWQKSLGANATKLDCYLPSIAEQFHLSGATISRLAEQAMNSQQPLEEALWSACRLEARHGLDQLAVRIESHARWDDLVLPEASITSLRTIAAQVRQRSKVYREWGFAENGDRGLGIAALFSGGSGTGKTLAAEVLANELQLDLFRVDLAALVSKFIGETEKNLAKVFDAAEVSGAILLFDEADALFGKRSEVRDSHDRYANLEVSYLLQRIETYRGLAILTTNLKQSIDTAFQRRIRFVVHFPFPDVEARSAIWQRIFPVRTPTLALDVSKLARLSLSGGHIRNLALNAAFLAADEGDVVSMRHLHSAAETEFAKLEKPLPGNEVGDWI